MANPGVAGSQIPAGEDHVMRAIADIRRELRELAPSIAKSFQPVIARLDATDADLIAKQATLDAQQATLTTAVAGIAANVASINDLLTQVVKPQAVYFETQNFALSHTTASTFTSATVTVPAGFTSAVVSLVGRVFATNPNTGADYLSAVTKIDGVGGDSVPLLVGGSGGSGHNVSSIARVLPGLTPGGTFVLALLGNSNIADWAANASNVAEVSGTILWFR